MNIGAINTQMQFPTAKCDHGNCEHRQSDAPAADRRGTDMSPMARMLGGPDELTTEQREEMKGFAQEMRNALRDGEFDAKAFADRAPGFMKEKAAAQGSDLSSLFSEAQEKFDAMRASGGGRFGGLGGGGNPYATGLEEAESSLLALLGDDREQK